MPHPFVARAVVLLSVTAIACQPMPPRSDEAPTPGTPESGVTIDVDRTRYAPGGRVEIRITNHTSDTVGFNACTRIVERRQGDAWVMVPEPGRVCTMEISLLRPHSSRAATTELPASLARGTYRLALVLTRERGGTPPTPTPIIRAVSAPFQVE